MTDSPPPVVIAPQVFEGARWRRSTQRLSLQLERLSVSTRTLAATFRHLEGFLDHQHRLLREAVDRSDEVEHFCRRCQEIIDGNDPDRMARERDWLIAGYRKRNAHRRRWLDRLGLRQ